MNAGSWACRDATHRPWWWVSQRWCNYSAFNGYRKTPSAYSLVECPLCPAQFSGWRTKAGYVNELPGERHRVIPSTSKELAVICPHTSWSGGEMPIDVMGRYPVLWVCDGCGKVESTFHRWSA